MAIKETRGIMRIELTPKARKSLDGFCDGIGMTKIAAMSRLVEWFVQQPDSVKALIQGFYPESIKEDVVKLILEAHLKS